MQHNHFDNSNMRRSVCLKEIRIWPILLDPTPLLESLQCVLIASEYKDVVNYFQDVWTLQLQVGFLGKGSCTNHEKLMYKKVVKVKINLLLPIIPHNFRSKIHSRLFSREDPKKIRTFEDAVKLLFPLNRRSFVSELLIWKLIGILDAFFRKKELEMVRKKQEKLRMFFMGCCTISIKVFVAEKCPSFHLI